MPAIALSATAWNSLQTVSCVHATTFQRELRTRQRRSQVVGDIVADAGQRMDHGLHLVEHAVDDDRQSRKRLVDITMWKPLAQIAGDDALNPLD